MTDERDTAPVSLARDLRDTVARHPRADRIYRTSVGVAGGGAVALGALMIPLPGPGVAVVLGGLALLGTEFEGARRVNAKAVDLTKRGVQRIQNARAARAARQAAATTIDGSAEAAQRADVVALP